MKKTIIALVCVISLYAGVKFVKWLNQPNQVTWMCGTPNAATFTFSADYDAERFQKINQTEADINPNSELVTVCVYK